MRVEWAFACRYAETDGSTATIVGAGIDVFFAPLLPTMVGMIVVLKLVGTPDEWEDERDLGFKILGPEAEVVKEEETTKMTGQFKQLFETYERAATIVTAHQFQVEAAGPYSLEISIDGENKKSVPFYIHEGPPPPAPEPES